MNKNENNNPISFLRNDIVASSKGNLEHEKSLTLANYLKMMNICENHIKSFKDVCLVSGGAAWCDHLAVSLYLAHPEAKLILHLPYLDTIDSLSLKYHKHFQAKTGIDSLKEIEKAIKQGATVYHYDGFYKRNDQVAKSPILLAFAFTDIPSVGGTGYTWKKVKTEKYCWNILKL